MFSELEVFADENNANNVDDNSNEENDVDDETMSGKQAKSRPGTGLPIPFLAPCAPVLPNALPSCRRRVVGVGVLRVVRAGGVADVAVLGGVAAAPRVLRVPARARAPPPAIRAAAQRACARAAARPRTAPPARPAPRPPQPQSQLRRHLAPSRLLPRVRCKPRLVRESERLPLDAFGYFTRIFLASVVCVFNVGVKSFL